MIVRLVRAVIHCVCVCVLCSLRKEDTERPNYVLLKVVEDYQACHNHAYHNRAALSLLRPYVVSYCYCRLQAFSRNTRKQR